MRFHRAAALPLRLLNDLIDSVTSVKHQVEIEKPPSIVFEKLMDVGRIREWAPVVVNSTCSESEVREGTHFMIDADLKPVGGPKFHFNSVIAESVKDRRVLWRQTNGPMKKLEWSFELNPGEKGTMLSLTISYKMPYSVFGYLMDRFKMNKVIDSACRVNLEGLKGKLESST